MLTYKITILHGSSLDRSRNRRCPIGPSLRQLINLKRHRAGPLRLLADFKITIHFFYDSFQCCYRQYSTLLTLPSHVSYFHTFLQSFLSQFYLLYLSTLPWLFVGYGRLCLPSTRRQSKSEIRECSKQGKCRVALQTWISPEMIKWKCIKIRPVWEYGCVAAIRIECMYRWSKAPFSAIGHGSLWQPCFMVVFGGSVPDGD